MGGSSQKRHTSQNTYIRYAPYIESHHTKFLLGVYTNRVAAVANNPYENYVDVDVESAFFGAGYLISDFPSLFDMYGKFMAGLDIDVLWEQIFEETVDSTVVSDLTSTEALLMDDEIETTTIPKLQTGLRDINSVIASSLPLARAVVEDGREKAVAKYRAELRYRLIPVAQARWQTHLQWNQQVISIYAEVLKFYFAAKHDVDEDNYSMAAKYRLWPFTVLDFERAALGALQGATSTKQDVAGASTASRVLSGALSGAAMGAMIGSTITTASDTWLTTATASGGGTYAGAGAVVGAIVGAAAAYTY